MSGAQFTAVLIGAMIAVIAVFAAIFSGLNSSSIAKKTPVIESLLPEGCSFHDIGHYGRIDQLVLVVCEDREVQTTITRETRSTGKSTVTNNSSSIVIGN